MYILSGIDPDFRSHDGDEQVRGVAAHRLHRDTLSLEVRDAADAFVTEQPEAACMDAGQDRDRGAAINRARQGRRKIQSEIQPAAADRLRKVTPEPYGDIANIGKTLGAQQIVERSTWERYRSRPGRVLASGALGFRGLARRPATMVRGRGPPHRPETALSESGGGSVLSTFGTSLSLDAHAFSSRLSSSRKRQSVPSAMMRLGLLLIMPSSCSRRA